MICVIGLPGELIVCDASSTRGSSPSAPRRARAHRGSVGRSLHLRLNEATNDPKRPAEPVVVFTVASSPVRMVMSQTEATTCDAKTFQNVCENDTATTLLVAN